MAVALAQALVYLQETAPAYHTARGTALALGPDKVYLQELVLVAAPALVFFFRQDMAQDEALVWLPRKYKKNIFLGRIFHFRDKVYEKKHKILAYVSIVSGVKLNLLFK